MVIRRSREAASVLMAVVGLVLVIAGPVLAMQGVQGHRAVEHELAAQRLAFPADKARLPDALQKYAGEKVTTGHDAKLYADLISTQAAQVTGGRTYAELAAGGAADEKPAQTALAAEMQRTSLLGAYQADRVGSLFIGLGVLLAAVGAVFALTGFSLRPPRIVVPDSPEALETLHLRLR
ncbi:hypothetical protein ODJ79_46220 [Actinoplanes sp. KI2]|uniref:hypothetical protein n=1 Tax=Actinoplanes sp. KI2 TaxID=2983315 RepID=UPI0021D58C95|nr:hypothetical protein [Actinoplanes sp. KI2]MCU7731154.1 hypothetical protein [Actinoplanes sp. KI2]